MIDVDRKMPASVEAEQMVLAALVLSEKVETFDRITDLQPEHFFHPPHRTIFRALLDLRQEGIAPSLFELKELLRQRGEIDKIGNAFFSAVLEPMPDIAHIDRYAEIVIEAANARALIRACSTAALAAADRRPIVEVTAELEAAISSFGLPEDLASRGVFDIVRDVHAAADQRVAEGRPLGILTGFPNLDRATGGLPRRALTVVAAPSSHGKTTLAINIAQNAVERRSDVRAVLYSLEMSKQAISDRITARRGQVPLGRVREWRLNEFERQNINDARESLVDLNARFFIADRITTVSDLIADARKKKSERGLDLIIVDYLQLVAGVDEDTRERVVNGIAWTLFELAKDLDIAVLALSQVTPAAQYRTSGRLSIDDLRDSKAIGHHARVVLMLHRPRQSAKENGSIPWCSAVLQIEKNSEGEVGDITLHFSGEFQEFAEGDCRPGCRYFGRSAVA